MRWCSGTVDDFRHDVHSFSFDRSTRGTWASSAAPTAPSSWFATRGISSRSRTWSTWTRARRGLVYPRDDLGGESFQSKLRSMSTEAGVDVEIDRFTASLSVKLGIARAIGHLGGFLPYSGGAFPDAVDSRVGDFARSLRAFARAGDPDVVFVKYEELLGAKTDGLTLLGEWLGLRRGEAEMRAFVEACVDAREDERARVKRVSGRQSRLGDLLAVRAAAARAVAADAKEAAAGGVARALHGSKRGGFDLEHRAVAQHGVLRL